MKFLINCVVFRNETLEEFGNVDATLSFQTFYSFEKHISKIKQKNHLLETVVFYGVMLVYG